MNAHRKLPKRSSLDRSPEGIDSPANSYLAPPISGAAFADKPAFRMPHFKYTGEAKVVMRVDVDMYAEVVIVGQPENGAYEWLIVNEIVGGFTVERHSDCGYGQKSIALRDGLIAYHGAV
jgi:hypothetical protein